jgi:uncharacterized protein involved in outer membrane biogenesis
LRRIFGRIIIAVLTLFILVIILIWRNEDRIVSGVVEKLNESLHNPIEIEKIELGWLRTFPHLALVLNEIKIPDRNNNTLATFKTAIIKLPFKMIMNPDAKINQLKCRDGEIQVEHITGGDNNYDIFKSDKDKKGQHQITLDRVELHNVFFRYLRDNNEELGMLINESDHRIILKDGIISLDTKGNFQIEHVRISEKKELLNQSVTADGKLLFHLPKGHLSFNHYKIQLNDFHTVINGDLDFTGSGTDWDIRLGGKHQEITQLSK